MGLKDNMNKKSMILLICWIALCVGLIIFMIIHIIIQQSIALSKENNSAVMVHLIEMIKGDLGL